MHDESDGGVVMTGNFEELASKTDSDLLEWGVQLQAAVCENCDWSFLLPVNYRNAVCPHCFQSRLEIIDGEIDSLPHISSPEMILPFKVSEVRLNKNIQDFVKRTPFPPDDLQATNLHRRLRHVFLPVWLVDVKAKARWQAELGFDYQVVSHQERYEQNLGKWKTQQIEEQRIRWEPRVGTLDRNYQNIAAPALENYAQIRRSLGRFDFHSSVAYSAAAIGTGVVCLPDRSRQDAWQNVLPNLQSIAADECRQACEGDHVRQFTWDPAFEEHHWTLLLQPVLTSYYLDGEKQPQSIMINGQSGQLFGVQRASMKKATQVSVFILMAALLLFIISLGSLALIPLAPVFVGISAVGAAISFLIALTALIPVIIVWRFNRSRA